MKKLLTFLILLCAAAPSFAQYAMRQSVAEINVGGTAHLLPGAQIKVCQYNILLQCNTPATIYSDPNGQNQITQPLSADNNGNYQYFVLAGSYVEQISYPGVTSQTYAVMPGGSGVTANKWTTPRNLAGNSVDGSADVPFGNKFIVGGTTDNGVPNAQFLGALPTGILKNTNGSGILGIAGASDFPTLNANIATNLAGGSLGSLPYQSGNGATSLLSGNATTAPCVVTEVGTGTAAQAPTCTSAPAISAANMTNLPGGLVNLNGSSVAHQSFVSGNNISIATDTNLGTHTFSVTGLTPLALSGNWADIQSKPTSFPPSLPTSTMPGGVYIPVACPPVTDPLTSASVPQHVYGINASNGQLLCSPDNNWDLQLQVNGTTVAAGVRAINFVGSSGMQITAANNTGTGVVTYTVTGSTATQAQSPTFSPLPGAYSGAQSVTLACASPSPTIYYTTNGSTPTHSSSSYSSPISISAGTIKAICASSGLTDSNEADGIYSQTAPIATLASTSLTFGNQLVGSTSTAQTVGLSNTGNATLTISSLSFTGTNSGDFSQTNDCGASLAAGSSCTIDVSFTPGATGARTGTLNVNDNASGSPQAVSITGTGALPTGGVSPSTLTYTSTAVGSSSGSQTVTLSNSGTVPMTVSSVALSGTNAGDYSIQSNNCLSVAASGSCNASIVFTPTAGGTRTATLTFTSNASNSPQTVSITGTGSAPAASVSPSSLTYSSQIVGTSSSSQAVTVHNTGTSNLGFSSIGITGANSGDFAQSNNCTTLAPNASCTANVTFTPQATGSRSASLSLSDNAPGSPHTVSLSGTGVIATVTVSPSTLTFQQVQGVTSVSQAVTLTNTSSYTDTISSIAVTSDYAQTNNCGTSLAAGASCTINVTFTPSVLGTDNGALTITDYASGSPHTISLSGTGYSGQATAIPMMVVESVAGGQCYSPGPDTWYNKGNITSPSNYATFTTTSRYSTFLYLTNLGFTIPSASRVNGIIVTQAGYDPSGHGVVRNLALKGGTIVCPSTGYDSYAFNLPTTSTSFAIGSASFLWGTTWTGSDINDVGFGVVVYGTDTGVSPATVYLHNVQITVYYGF